MAERVLITGAGGFIGRNAARYLSEQGFHVIGIGRTLPDSHLVAPAAPLEWHTSEITLDALTRFAGQPDVILHCAGSGSVSYSNQSPLDDFDRNVGTLAAVLEFVRTRAPRARVVYPSSAAVYGIAEHKPLPENTPLNPVSPYGSHKLIAEQLCKSYAANFGVAVAVVRLFSVYGAGLRKQLLWDACDKISRGQAQFFGAGDETRDWLHVSDAARLLLSAANHATDECPIANGGTGVATENRALLHKVFECFGRNDGPRFSGDPRPGDPRHYQAYCQRAQAWGWTPAVQWQSGVTEYVDWYRKEFR